MWMEWLLDKGQDHLTKLWRFEVVGDKCLRGRNSWESNKRFSNVVVKAMPKVLEAHVGEAVWPIEPIRG